MKFYLFFTLFLMNCLLLVIPSKSDNISYVCTKTKNPIFWKSALGSSFSGKIATLTSLEVKILQLTKASATTTYNKIQSLISRTKDPKLQSLLSQCGNNYRDTLIGLQQARNYLVYKQFDDLGFTALGISDDGTTCENAFKKRGVASPITQGNNELSSFGDIIQVIAHILAG